MVRRALRHQDVSGLTVPSDFRNQQMNRPIPRESFFSDTQLRKRIVKIRLRSWIVFRIRVICAPRYQDTIELRALSDLGYQRMKRPIPRSDLLSDL
jgi:hypothetical protein